MDAYDDLHSKNEMIEESVDMTVPSPTCRHFGRRRIGLVIAGCVGKPCDIED